MTIDTNLTPASQLVGHRPGQKDRPDATEPPRDPQSDVDGNNHMLRVPGFQKAFEREVALGPEDWDWDWDSIELR